MVPHGSQISSDDSLRVDPADISMISTQTDITDPEQSGDRGIDPDTTQPEGLDHILNATAYYEKLDILELDTAETCGIRWEPMVQTGGIIDCLQNLKKCRAAVRNLQSEGFCGSMLSILVEDQSRPDVANAIHLSLSEINFLVSSLDLLNKGLCSQYTQDSLAQVVQKFLGGSLYGPQLIFWWTQTQFVSAVLSIGLVSFSGSHVCRFDLNLWGKLMDLIPVGFGYSFRPRELACLKDFVGGPAWVLGRTESQSGRTGLKVSLMVQDLQELWGPVWLVGGTADAGPVIRTERGYIVPLPRDEQADASLSEIECHWAKQIPDYITQEESILLSSTSRILIGTDTVNTARLTLNPSCESQICQIQQHIHHQLQFSGTCNDYYTMEGHDVQLIGGQYVNFGLVKKYKRNPMRTMKSAIIEACRNPGIDVWPLLKLRIGLEISACAGNAQRVTLWMPCACHRQENPLQKDHHIANFRLETQSASNRAGVAVAPSTASVPYLMFPMKQS